MDFDTQEANVKLIKQIKLRPCLYNRNLPSYNRKSVQDKAWAEIATHMGWQASQCKERWRNLRCVYIRHIKRMHQGIHKRPYYLMKLMNFALPHIKLFTNDPLPKEIVDALQADDDKGSETNGDEEEQHDTQKDPESQLYKSYIGSESPELSHSFATEFIPTTSVQIKHEDDSRSSDLNPRNDSQRGRPRMTGSNEFEIEIPDLAPNIDLKTDARKMFLYSLLPDVYEMSDAQMRQFKLKVLNIIGDILDGDK